jgi:serine/threonine-protein kinase
MTVIGGQLITPSLRLVRMLGRGGMGSVWVADHLTLHTQVAVKFMSVRFAEEEAHVRRFKAEALAAVQIKSPHVAQVFDHGVTSEGEPFIVMELLDGEDLRARMKQRGALSPAEFAPILTQVAKALTRAHQVGIVHRDIKPDNIFLTGPDDDLLVKVLDFGIAKITDDGCLGATVTGSMLGTPFYMSPEQLLSSRSVDFRSDLWSLGVVTYLALTGIRPFRGETIGAISVAVNDAVFDAPSSARPGLSPSIDSWMERALQKEPARRFGSAREMAEAFERAVSDASASAEMAPASTTVVEGAPKASMMAPTLAGTSNPSVPARPRRGPWLLGVAVLGAAAAGAGVLARTGKLPHGIPRITLGPATELGVREGSPGHDPGPSRDATNAGGTPAPSASAEPASSAAPAEVPPQVTVAEPRADAGIAPSASAWLRKAPGLHPWSKSSATTKSSGSADGDSPPPAPRKKDDIGF